MSTERRVPCRGEGAWWVGDTHQEKKNSKVPGTISWADHLEAYEGYKRLYPGSAADQSAERLSERGGFGFFEFKMLAGHEPASWQPVVLSEREKRGP